MHEAQRASDDYQYSEQISREMVFSNTKVLRMENDITRLLIIEILIIGTKNSALNKQATGNARILKQHSSMPPRVILERNNNTGSNEY